ncbi:beta-glycosyltransferase/ family 2 [Synechococcus sp. Minos11]|nr:beta-glycosyltransferase/ family 2 [Synechococcus sp. Minos11]
MRENSSVLHHDEISLASRKIESKHATPLLIKYGSINGNITGMVFSKQLFNDAGPFREDWRHAADWEWLIRATEKGPILLNRKPIAVVRTHEEQLSVKNRKSGHELVEVSEVVKILLNHPDLASMKSKKIYASHIMQFQLWNLIKTNTLHLSERLDGFQRIHESSGIVETFLAFVMWFPVRIKRRWMKSYGK